MVNDVKTFDAKKLMGVSRAFTHFLALANSAENHHRIRRLRQRLSDTDGGLVPKDDSCAGSVKRLVTSLGIPPAEIMAAMRSQTVEIVLTGWLVEFNETLSLSFPYLPFPCYLC